MKRYPFFRPDDADRVDESSLRGRSLHKTPNRFATTVAGPWSTDGGTDAIHFTGLSSFINEEQTN